MFPRTLLALAVCVASSAQAQQGPRTAVVTATDAVIAIDGIIDEAAWANAPEIGELVQRQPRTGAAPTERTDVKMLHDGRTLYIAAIAYDSRAAPGDRHADGTRCGAHLRRPHRDPARHLPRPAQCASISRRTRRARMIDGLVFANGELNTDWDAIWHARTRRTDAGMGGRVRHSVQEPELPRRRHAVGLQFLAHIYRKLEESRWSGARLETQFLQVSEAGVITNLEGADAGHRPRRAAVRRRALAALRRRVTTNRRASRGSMSSTTSRRA